MNAPPAQNKEDLIAENILKRAEIARITRQLKSRLAQAGIKAKMDLPIAKDTTTSSVNSLPSVAAKRSSSLLEVNGPESDDFEESPTKKSNRNNLPSSPLYSNQPPKTPPSNKSSLNSLPNSTTKLSKAQEKILLSTPKSSSKRLSNQILKTPTRVGPKAYEDEEGADLLMFLATSPSPAAYKTSFTPRSSGMTLPSFNLMTSPAINGSTATSTNILKDVLNRDKFEFATPATPKRNNTLQLTAKTPTHSKSINTNLLATPSGFNMNDYVNFFTPSPNRLGVSSGVNNSNLMRTPELFNKNLSNVDGSSLSGKMINFDKVGFGITTNANGVARFSASPLRRE